MLLMVDVFGYDVHIAVICWGVAMLCMTALLVSIHIDNKKEEN